MRLVDVLEFPVPDLGGRHQAGQQQQRHPVEVGVDNPGERVQRAGAGGRDADAEPAGQSGVGTGGKGGGVLVAHQHPADAVLPLQRRQQRHQRRPRIAEDMPDPERAEDGDDVIRNIHASIP